MRCTLRWRVVAALFTFTLSTVIMAREATAIELGKLGELGLQAVAPKSAPVGALDGLLGG